MNEITRNRFRPILVTIFWCHFFFSGIEVDYPDSELLSQIFLLILLVSMLAFKIREKISIDNEFLFINLHKVKLKCALTDIKEIAFLDCFNEIEIKTANLSSKLNISQFHSKKVETFFTENGLYQPEIDGDIEYNQSLNVDPQKTRAS